MQKTSTGREIQTWARAGRSQKHYHQSPHAEEVHTAQPQRQHMSTPRSPLSFGGLSGMQSTPYSSLSRCKAGGHVQVA